MARRTVRFERFYGYGSNVYIPNEVGDWSGLYVRIEDYKEVLGYCKKLIDILDEGQGDYGLHDFDNWDITKRVRAAIAAAEG